MSVGEAVGVSMGKAASVFVGKTVGLSVGETGDVSVGELDSSESIAGVQATEKMPMINVKMTAMVCRFITFSMNLASLYFKRLCGLRLTAWDKQPHLSSVPC